VPKKTADNKKDEARREIDEALQRAEKGDRSALPTVRKYLDAQDEGWWSAMDFACIVQHTQIQRCVGEDSLFAQELLSGQVQRLRAQLGGPAPSPLERLLVERIIACWLHVNYAEEKYAEELGRGMSFEKGEYYQKRIDRAHRRYLSAIRALAQVRRLLGPSVQVNIGEQQVNVAGR
jgi:hypothetical protein